MSPWHVAIVAHPKIKNALEQAHSIYDYLVEKKVDCVYGFLHDELIAARIEAGEINLMIALGGDGTMLRAGHICGPAQVPVLGINVGHFGFLMEVQNGQWREIMPRLLAGDFWLEKRMMVKAEYWQHGKLLSTWDVLNEVVIGRGQMVRPVHLETFVDGRFLTTYVADALLAATPTGSTAYALAAGGPILPPDLRNILLIAVAPHLSVDRAIVLSEGSSVSITVHSDHQAVLSIDGQAPVFISDGDEVHVRASEHTVSFIRFQDPGYFYRNLTQYMNQNPATGTRR